MELEVFIVYSHISFAFAAWNFTQILVKEYTNLSHPRIHPIRRDGGFEEIIQLSDLWIDKSLLIYEMWTIHKDIKVFINTSPRRWGKSTTLSMLDYYHSLPVKYNGSEADVNTTANYLYFIKGEIIKDDWVSKTVLPPLISSYKSINDEHLGKHPVIHMVTTCIKIKENYLDDFRAMIQETYKQHMYIKLHLERQLSTCTNSTKKMYMSLDIAEFDKHYNNENLSEDDLKLSIKTLSEILGRTYKKEVIILMDEYDSFIGNTYFGALCTGQLPQPALKEKFLDFLKDFMQKTFKENVYLAKAVITGILPIRDIIGLSSMNNAGLKYAFGYDDLYPYYGVFKDEFLTLCDKRGISGELLEAAIAKYDGYHVLSHLPDAMFSTYSVVGFINTLTLVNFWVQTSTTRSIDQLLIHQDFKDDLIKLFRHWRTDEAAFKIPYSRIITLTIADFETIYNLMAKNIEYKPLHHRDGVFSFLMSIGYVSIHRIEKVAESSHHENKEVAVTIPNIEIFNDLKDKLMRSVELDFAGIDKADLRKFMNKNDSSTLQPLMKSMSKFLHRMLKNGFSHVQTEANALSKIFSDSGVSGNEKTVESLLKSYLLKLMAHKVTVKLDYSPIEVEQYTWEDSSYGRQMIDIFFMDDAGKSALIMELKYVENETKDNTSSVHSNNA